MTDNKSARYLCAVFVYNEGEKLRKTLEQIPAANGRDYDVVVMNDGSTDHPERILADYDFHVLNHGSNRGAGAAVRTALHYAMDEGYDAVALIAGNAKMRPSEVPALLKPIREDGVDYVQGSRYLAGGRSENLPLFRRIMIPLFTRIVRLLTGHRGTDVTCGMRAYRLDIIRHPAVDIDQSWLEKYEMEYYIHYNAIKRGFKLAEVPVSMLYPPDMKNYSKIRALTGWWSMIRPWVFLTLGLRK